MTPQKWYNLRQGQSLLVPGAKEADRGQCMQAADYALNEVYGLPYIWTDGAIDWWNKYDSIAQLKNHFFKVAALNGYPKAGDFVIWGSGVGSIYGHIDLALQDGNINGFLGADSNWGGNKTVHQVQHNYTSVLGYLRPNNQGGDMPIGTDKVDKDSALRLWQGWLHRNPQPGDLDQIIGKNFNDATAFLDASAERHGLDDKLKWYDGLVNENAKLKEQASGDGTTLAPGKYVVKG